MASEKEKNSKSTEGANDCSGDGKTWTEAADKAQDELDKTGAVERSEADEMKRHAGA